MDIEGFEHAGGILHGIKRIESAHAAKLIDAVKSAFELLDSREFCSLLERVPAQDFDHHADPTELRQADGARVLVELRSVAAKGFLVEADWHPPFFLRKKSVAKTIKSDGQLIKLNPYFVRTRPAEGFVGTFVHELAHLAGYSHDGNRRKGNEATVPHFVGDLARWVELGRRKRPQTLPADACDALRRLVVLPGELDVA